MMTNETTGIYLPLPQSGATWMPSYGPKAHGSKLVAFIEMWPTLNGTGPMVTVPGVSRYVKVEN